MSRSTSWFLLVFGLASLLLVRESRQPGGALAGVDRAFFDWLVANARPDPPGRGEIPVTLVEIDDAVADSPGRLPLSALEYGAFLRSVGRFDPAVVAVEPVLAFPHTTASAEQILSEEAFGISKLLLGVQLGDNAANGRDPASLPALANAVAGKVAAVPDYPEIVAAPDSRLLTLAAASVATNLTKTTGPVRDLPLIFRCRNRVLPAFTLQILTLALRLAPAEIDVAPGAEVRLGDRLSLPVNRAGRALLDAREFSRFGRLGLDDLPLIEAGQAPPQTRALAERLRHGVVILGRTDRAARTLRRPDGGALSPAEVFAWAATSLQRAPPTRRASSWPEAAVVALFVGAGLAGRRRRRFAALVLAAATLLFYLLAALSLFEGSRLWLPLALPGGLALLTMLLIWLLPEPSSAPSP